MNDLVIAIRRLKELPGFTLAAISLLAFGIAVTSVLFSALDSFILRPLAVDSPDRLVEVFAGRPQNPEQSISYIDYLALRDQADAFSGITIYQTRGAILKKDGVARGVPAGVVSPGHFQVLGLKPAIGDFSRSGAVISHAFWQREFAGRPDIVGQDVVFNGRHVEIVAVADPSYHGLELLPVDVWFAMDSWLQISGDTQADLEDPRGYRFSAWARLAPGRTTAQAQAQLDVIAKRIAAAHPELAPDRKFTARLESDLIARRNALAATLFGPIAIIIMLVPSANLLGLVLIHAHSRRREMAIRLALGASRSRILRQLLCESLTLAAMGVGFGLLLTRYVIGMIPKLLPPLPIQVTFDIRVDHRTLLFASAMAAISVIACTLLPMRQVFSRMRLSSGGFAMAEHRRRWKMTNVVVGVQIALSLALLATAGLLAQSYRNSLSLNPGFQPAADVLLVQTVPRPDPNSQLSVAYYRELQRRVAALPGVIEAPLSRSVPLSMEGGGGPKSVRLPAHEKELIAYNAVQSEYFHALGVPLLTGRAMHDDAPEVVINQTMAERYWPNASPIGDVIHVDDVSGGDFTVVGIAAAGKYGSVHEPAKPHLYLPYSRVSGGMSWLVVRASAVNPKLREEIRNTVSAISDDAIVLSFMSSTEHFDRALIIDRLIAGGVSGVSILATFIAVIGLYGAIAFSVRLRQQDLAIRIALGAHPADVIRMVLREGFLLAAIGTLFGIAGAFGISQVIRGLLYEVRPGDPITFAAVSALVLLLTLIASLIPARRAARIDPAVLLKTL